MGFLMNVWHAFFQDQGYGETIDSFPFERDETYGNELPYSSKCQSAESKPNIIIIFTEGTSSRLLGCYNPVYSDLTPNIDAFAKNSMVVKNYYNHTAATFRGTQGQLTSCYPFQGGAGKCGWNNTAGLLSKGCYKSLPQMLNKNYHTVFISPHKEADPYTGLIKSLGFKGLYTRDSVNELLDYEPGWENESVKDEDMYNALIGFLEHYDEKQPFMLAMYTFGTHTDLDVPVDGKHFMNGDNSVLNTLYNDDAAFGQFWEYFSHSKFAKNTIVIFTADHTHYHDKPFMKLMDNEKDYTKCFIDRIPLIIYDPIHDLPSSYDANDKTSISLAPTVCQLLKVKKEKNSFMGNSIFDEDGINEHIAAIGDSFYVIQNHKVCEEKYFNDSDGNAKRMIDDILMFYRCEKNNHVYKADDY